MVEWLVSESMVMYYIHLFRDSMWPGGELAKPAAQRTDLVKEFIIIMNNFCYCEMVLSSLLFVIVIGASGVQFWQ